MRKIILSTICTFLLIGSLWGQAGSRTITGHVYEKTTVPLQSVTLLLLNLPDSSYITGTISGAEGKFILENIPATTCLLEISMLGFNKKQIHIPSYPDSIDVGTILLEEDIYLLSDIVVTATQKQIEMEAGKTVVNLSATILGSQGNVVDALKNLPGVVIRDDGSIYLNGQAGVNILINNKLTYLSGENLLNMLQSISSSSVDKIELITHPSSRYDAAGNSGLINIRTKKVRLEGYNLTANTNLQQGKYTKGNEGIFLTLRKNKFNFYIDYSHYWGEEYMLMNSFGRYFDPATALPRPGERNIYADRRMHDRSHYIRTGLDYDLSEQFSIGTYITSNWYKWEKKEMTQSDFMNEALRDSTLLTHNNYNKHHTNITGGVNINYNPDERITWDASFDFQLFNSSDNLSQLNSFDTFSSTLPKDTLAGGVDGGINIYTGQTNLIYNFTEKFRLTTGIKTAFVHVDNDVVYRNFVNNNWIINKGLSSQFSYKENINAIYAQLNAQWNPVLSTEMGIRMENTHVKGKQNDFEKDSTFTQNYTHLFPTGMVNYSPSEKHSFSLLYGQRIIRPNYRDLNPFVEVNDSYLHEKGNTELKPQLTHNVELSYFLKRQYGISLFYSYLKHPISKSYLVDENDIVIVSPMNLSSNHIAGIRLGFNNIHPLPWWTLHVNSSFTYKQFQWTMMETYDENKLMTPMVHVSNHFSLPKGWTAEISGFYNGKMAEGQATIDPLWMVSAGIKKNVLKNNGTIYLYANDIFRSNQIKVTMNGPVLKGWYAEETDTRIVGLTFTYRFNSGKTKDSRRENRIDESKRINL